MEISRKASDRKIMGKYSENYSIFTNGIFILNDLLFK